jgi:hypothetical protein
MTRIYIDPLDYWDGEENLGPTTLAYWDGTTATPLEQPLLSIPRGYASVTDMLSRPMVYMAHRGGSAEYPEHSLRAYTQAVIEGFGCLEWSTQRTSDGVFIGCHDPSINAVVYGGGTFPNISAMTWAQIQAQQIKPPAGHPERSPQPFMRLEELIEKYGKTHVIMIDPKNIGSAHYAQLLNLMDANGGPARWIGKWVGGNSAWSTALRARGYKSWGAFYSTDDRTMVTNSQAQWDVLGFNFGGSAPQEDWDFILSFGKRVWAHVCPDQASVDTGVAKGATGAQVSGTEAVDVYKVF